MTAVKIHLERVKEHLEELEDAIKIGIDKRPATIGLHTSACSIELLELYMHKSNKITSGQILKHDWFKRPLPNQKKEPKIDRYLKANFDKKDEIYNLIYSIEERRNNLIYGNSKKEEVEAVLHAFNKLKGIMGDLLKKEGVEIED